MFIQTTYMTVCQMEGRNRDKESKYEQMTALNAVDCVPGKTTLSSFPCSPGVKQCLLISECTAPKVTQHNGPKS
jgi:hypothetical protein